MYQKCWKSILNFNRGYWLLIFLWASNCVYIMFNSQQNFKNNLFESKETEFYKCVFTKALKVKFYFKTLVQIFIIIKLDIISSHRLQWLKFNILTRLLNLYQHVFRLRSKFILGCFDIVDFNDGLKVLC